MGSAAEELQGIYPNTPQLHSSLRKRYKIHMHIHVLPINKEGRTP